MAKLESLTAITAVNAADLLYVAHSASFNSRKITFTNFVTQVDTTGDFVTSNSISARVVTALAEYVTSASLATAYQPAGDYATSNSISGMIVTALGEYVTSASLSSKYAVRDLGPNAQTGTAYELVLADEGQVVTMSNVSANTLTIPSSASIAFAVGATVNVIQIGAGATTIAAGTGVTLNGVATGSGAINTQYQGVSLLKITDDTWVASGDIATVA